MATSLETGPATERECPQCGSATVPLQEYCLECGARLPPDPEAPRRARRAAAAWPLLASGIVALLAGAVVVVAQLATDESRPTLALTATTAIPTAELTTAPPEAPPTTTPEPAAQPPAQTGPQGPSERRVISWPEDRRGWTVVILSLPQAGGRQTATARAREVLEAGLPEVGVLESSRFSSLHPGYLVVFSGIYDSRELAEAAVSRAKDGGYGTAYAREIAP